MFLYCILDTDLLNVSKGGKIFQKTGEKPVFVVRPWNADLLLVVLLVDRDFWSFSVTFWKFSEGIKNPGAFDLQGSGDVWVRRFELPAS